MTANTHHIHKNVGQSVSIVTERLLAKFPSNMARSSLTANV